MNIYSEFKDGSILNRTMLCALRDYPADILNLMYKDCPDGIITGFDVKAEKNTLLINSGILKHNDRIFVMECEKNLEIKTGKWICGLSFNEYDKNNCRFTEVTPILSENETEIELCRFVYSEGAVLRNIPEDLNIIANPPRNTIDIRYRKISCNDGYYIPDKRIFQIYGSQILDSQNPDSEDIAFAYLCLNSILSISPVIRYLRKSDDISVTEIISSLNERINQSKTDKPQEVKKTPVKKQVSVC